jgi:hypothetical protein
VDAFPDIVEFLTARGYVIEPPRPGVQLLATRRGHSLGIFLPYVDFIFVHDLQLEGAGDAAAFARLHESDRAAAGSRFRLPRILRYRIPNVVSIGVSGGACAQGLIDWVEKPAPRRSAVGGETHSMYALDLERRRLHSQGPEATPTPHGGSTTTAINPTNRVYRLVTELAETLFATGQGAAPG